MHVARYVNTFLTGNNWHDYALSHTNRWLLNVSVSRVSTMHARRSSTRSRRSPYSVFSPLETVGNEKRGRSADEGNYRPRHNSYVVVRTYHAVAEDETENWHGYD